MLRSLAFGVGAICFKQSRVAFCGYGLVLTELLAPLLEAVEYEERDWENTYIIGDSGFTGPPTAELEAKWINISQGNTEICYCHNNQYALANRKYTSSSPCSRNST